MDPQQSTSLRLPTGADVRYYVATEPFDARPGPAGLQQSVATVATEVGKCLRWIDEHMDEISDFLRSSIDQRDTAWRYLLDLVDPFTGMTVAMSLEAKDRFHASFEDAAAQVVERAFLEPQLQVDIRAAIEASTLPAAHRKQLIAGLTFVETQQHEVAVPLLITALEGAFWRLANDRQVIERSRRGHWMTTREINGKKSRIRGIEELVKLRGLDLDADLVCFITTLTYGGAGNDFRHGTATDRWQLRSTFLIAALLGWLDTTGGLNAREAFRASASRRIHDRDGDLAQEASSSRCLRPTRETGCPF